MNEQKFRSEMRRAKTMQETEEYPRNEYWVGYQRGLRRLHHGDNFGTAEEHEQWMALVDSDDESRKQRGRGYRDALALGEISSRRGAPSKIADSVDLSPPRVSAKKAAEFHDKIKREKITQAEGLRRAVELYAAIDDDLARTTGRIVE